MFEFLEYYGIVKQFSIQELYDMFYTDMLDYLIYLPCYSFH